MVVGLVVGALVGVVDGFGVVDGGGVGGHVIQLSLQTHFW